MRQRRVILYDDDPAVLDGLAGFFGELGYEVVASGEPVVCVICGESEQCLSKLPCADILITDLEMPGMSGLELLERQSRHGCKMNPRNKAVLSGNVSSATGAAIRSLGCVVFQKPCRLGTLAAWVLECEHRIDVTQPLAARRRERREACSAAAILDDGRRADLFVAEVVNKSASGLCLHVEKTLPVAHVYTLRTFLRPAPARFEVRWTRPDLGGGCFAGMAGC